jgi:glutaredoxin 3
MSAIRKRLFQTIGSGLARLDELGGDARDYLKDRLDRSAAAKKIRELMQRRAAARDAAVVEAVAADAAERATAAASDRVAGRPAEPPLGDPEIPAQVYGKRSCPWSGRAVKLLEDRDIEHRFVDLDDSENETLANRLLAETRQNTVPYVFVRGEFIGGYNALSERDRLGQLEAMVRGDGDGGSIKIEVAERPNTDEVAPAEG